MPPPGVWVRQHTAERGPGQEAVARFTFSLVHIAGVHASRPLRTHRERGIDLVGNFSFWKFFTAFRSSLVQCCFPDCFSLIPFHNAFVPIQRMDTARVKNPQGHSLPSLSSLQLQGREVYLGRAKSGASHQECAWQPVSLPQSRTWGHFALGTATGRRI